MKAFVLSALACLLCTAAQAATITLNDTLCGTGTAICSNPAPGMSSLSFSPTYGRLTVMIDGVQYVSAPYSATAQGGTVYAADGTWKEVTTVFATWTTRVVSGRGAGYVTHWELKSGSVE